VCYKNGAELTLNFKCNAIGAYVVTCSDIVVEVSIDGENYKKFDLSHHKYSENLNYPETIMFATGLDKGNHEIKMHIKINIRKR